MWCRQAFFSREILNVRETDMHMYILAAVVNILFDPDVSGPSRSLLSQLRKVSAACKRTSSQLFANETVAIEWNEKSAGFWMKRSIFHLESTRTDLCWQFLVRERGAAQDTHSYVVTGMCHHAMAMPSAPSLTYGEKTMILGLYSSSFDLVWAASVLINRT